MTDHPNNRVKSALSAFVVWLLLILLSDGALLGFIVLASIPFIPAFLYLGFKKLYAKFPDGVFLRKLYPGKERKKFKDYTLPTKVIIIVAGTAIYSYSYDI